MFLLKNIIPVFFLMGINSSAKECPDYWTVYGSSCYLFGHQALDFFSAEHYCRQHNGYLVHINDEGENTFLREHLRYMNGDRWWIGLTDDDVENTYEWYGTKQRPEFTDWAKGQPDDYENDEDCVEINKGIGYGDHWNDATCSNHELPICERPCSRCCKMTSHFIRQHETRQRALIHFISMAFSLASSIMYLCFIW